MRIYNIIEIGEMKDSASSTLRKYIIMFKVPKHYKINSIHIIQKVKLLIIYNYYNFELTLSFSSLNYIHIFLQTGN